jgi:hypothetical protein
LLSGFLYYGALEDNMKIRERVRREVFGPADVWTVRPSTFGEINPMTATFTKVTREGKRVPDDYCEACEKQAASIECGHGQLCDECYIQVHGSMEAECEL